MFDDAPSTRTPPAPPHETAIRFLRAITEVARRPGSTHSPRLPERCALAIAILDTPHVGPDAPSQRLAFSVWEVIGTSMPDEEDWTRSLVWELTVGSGELSFASHEHLATMVQAGYSDERSWVATTTETADQARLREAWEASVMAALPKRETQISSSLRDEPGRPGGPSPEKRSS